MIDIAIACFVKLSKRSLLIHINTNTNTIENVRSERISIINRCTIQPTFETMITHTQQ